MKTISRFATMFVFAMFLVIPSLAVAGTRTIGQSCFDNSDCLPGLVCTSNSTCQSSVGGTQTTSGSGGINPSYLQGYKTSIIGIINGMLVPVLIAIAFITFLWGVYKYFILGADSDTERATGRQFVLWGIIGFVVIASVWALVNIVSGTLGLQIGNTAPLPPKI